MRDLQNTPKSLFPFRHPFVNFVAAATATATAASSSVSVCQKVGSSIRELEQLKLIAEENKVLCVPGHNYIHEPQIDRIKRCCCYCCYHHFCCCLYNYYDYYNDNDCYCYCCFVIVIVIVVMAIVMLF